jgi:hypothetical protein
LLHLSTASPFEKAQLVSNAVSERAKPSEGISSNIAIGTAAVSFLMVPVSAASAEDRQAPLRSGYRNRNAMRADPRKIRQEARHFGFFRLQRD